MLKRNWTQCEVTRAQHGSVLRAVQRRTFQAPRREARLTFQTQLCVMRLCASALPRLSAAPKTTAWNHVLKCQRRKGLGEHLQTCLFICSDGRLEDPVRDSHYPQLCHLICN